jgi:hypothetical protein
MGGRSFGCPGIEPRDPRSLTCCASCDVECTVTTAGITFSEAYRNAVERSFADATAAGGGPLAAGEDDLAR